jgi:hypothetical protein
MPTAVTVMDRSSFGANTDVIVVVDPMATRLLWVPRDIWCPEISNRINRAYAYGGHGGLARSLASLGIAVEHGICLLPAAIAAGFAGATITMPVSEEMEFWYPLEPQRPIEEGRKRIGFRPPIERLEGERIHQWIGARTEVDGGGSDVRRIRRQQGLTAVLLGDRFDFRRFLAPPDAVRISSDAALDELRSVRPGWAFETLEDLSEAEIDGKQVLLPVEEPPGR